MLVRIELADTSFGYGMLRQFPYVSFYDLRTDTPMSDIDAIVSKPVLFTLALHDSALATWEVIGAKPADDLLNQPILQFTQDITENKNCKIVDEHGNEKAAMPEECIGLERLAVWEASHLKDRLLDTLMGRPNKWAEALNVRLR
jgi:hypothetical protein